MNNIEIFQSLGFAYEKGKVSKKLSENCILQKDVNRTEWSVDILLKTGGVNTIPADSVKDAEMAELIKKEIKAVDDALNPRMADIEVVEAELVTLPVPSGLGGIVRPAVSASEALAAWREFQNLKKCILSKSDLQKIGDKDTIKKSGWRKFATFYNLTDRIVDETKENLPGGGYLWKIKVICKAPNGRETEGVGICASTERKFSHPEHDIYATAHTRSKNRAISDMIAAGEVSTEELLDGGF